MIRKAKIIKIDEAECPPLVTMRLENGYIVVVNIDDLDGVEIKDGDIIISEQFWTRF